MNFSNTIESGSDILELISLSGGNIAHGHIADDRTLRVHRQGAVILHTGARSHVGNVIGVYETVAGWKVFMVNYMS